MGLNLWKFGDLRMELKELLKFLKGLVNLELKKFLFISYGGGRKEGGEVQPW